MDEQAAPDEQAALDGQGVQVNMGRQEEMGTHSGRGSAADLGDPKKQPRQPEIPDQTNQVHTEDPKSQEDLAATLAELTSGDDLRAEAAALSLGLWGDQAVPALEALSQSEAADQRWWATRALAEIPFERAGQLLRQALDDPDRSVQQCAALALRQRPTPEAIPELLAALSSPDRLLAHLAADALVASGPAAVPGLIALVEKGLPAARLEAARALALSQDPRAIPALFQALDTHSALLEYWAGEGLERLGVGMTFFKP